MTNDDRAPRPEEMTDAQLDEFLATGNRELLDRLEATTNTNQLLTDLLRLGDGEQRPAEPPAPARRHDPDKPSAREMIRKRTLAAELANELGRALALARALDRAFALDRALALARALARARALDRGFDLAALNLSLDLAFDCAQSFDHALDHARARVYARELVTLLDRALSLAGKAALTLRAEEVDASGADLSDVEVGDIETLDGVVWTRETIWPAGIVGQVEAHSVEIGDGVYRVRLGQRDEARML